MRNNFLQDGDGDLSSIRLALVYALIVATIITFIIVFREISWEGVALVTAWLAPALGTKVWQSIAENKKDIQIK